MSETDYIGVSMQALLKFGRETGCAVWVAPHPTKPEHGKISSPGLYHLHGGANWANKAHYGVIVHRDSPDSFTTEITITKAKMGYPGGVGRLFLDYDPTTHTYQRQNWTPARGAAA